MSKRIMGALGTLALVDVLIVVLVMRHVSAPPESPPVPVRSIEQQRAGASPFSQPRPDVVTVSTGDGLLVGGRGDCRGRPATVRRGALGGGALQAPVQRFPQILGAYSLAAGRATLVGLDGSCRPASWTSRDGGRRWRLMTGRAPAWSLARNPATKAVLVRGRTRPVPCVPISLAAVDRRTSVVACGNGAVLSTADAGTTWQPGAVVEGLRAVSFDSARHGYALASVVDCPGAVLSTDNAGKRWRRIACLPQAESVTAAGEGAVVTDGSAVRLVGG